MPFDFESLKDQLVCPKTHANLVREGDTLVACEPEHRLRYTIRNDIPIMLIDEAEAVSQQEWSQIMQSHGRNPETGLLAD